MKLTRRFRWIITGIVLAIISTLFLTQFNTVRAAFSNLHMVIVLTRVEREIMQKSPAGQYYESLFWKHNDELIRIGTADRGKFDEMILITRMFVPGLEALLDGQGDSVKISAEQVERLDTYFDWLISVGSPALQEDIQKERARFPLDQFVDLTMTEALDFVNSTWQPESDITKTMVAGSDGNWAYYSHMGVYLEYPVSYNLQVAGEQQDYIYFIPSNGMPEHWQSFVMKVKIRNLPVDEKDSINPYFWYPADSIVWEKSIQTTDFQGIEFISRMEDPLQMHVHAYQYDEEKELAVDISVLVLDPPQYDVSLEYSQIIDQQYEYFQHMVEHVRIDEP
jgi:hypothetical protein